jgi:putative DNA primase/helicase
MEIPISNAEFISAIFPEDANVAVCSKQGDPNEGGWSARIFNENSVLDNNSNNYVNCSSFQLEEDGVFNVQIKNFQALYFISFDDVGTKVSFDLFNDFQFSWLIETSPSNFQAGIILNNPITDFAVANSFVKSIVDAGYSDNGARGASRWARLPFAINGKNKHLDEEGNPFECKLTQWHPEVRYSMEEIVEGLKLTTKPTDLPAANKTQPDANKIADKCQQIGAFRDNRGADQSEPLWRDCLGITAYCLNGEQISQEWSSGYDGYRESDTAKKIEHRLKAKPTTCKQFQQSNPDGCKGCTQNRHSPISLDHESDEKAIKSIPIEKFPSKSRSGVSIPATIENVAYMLAFYGILVKYNVISKKQIVHIPKLISTVDNADSVAMTHIISLANLNQIPVGQVAEFVLAIADRHQVNPVADWINSKLWDGVDRLPEFYNTLETEVHFPKHLKETLMFRWALSSVAAALKPSGFKCRGILTLQGAQSMGKTSWVSSLVPDAILCEQVVKVDHAIDPSDKDSKLTALSHWIVEMGELESSFKKDIDRLKGFITADMDKIRRPYARANSEYPRKTVFVATVNGTNFLVDPTGNTRFWTLPLVGLNYNHGIDMQQVFAQLAADYDKGEQWWLTREEEIELEKHNNANHRAITVVRELILNEFDPQCTAPKAITATELLLAIDIKNPSNPQAKECAAVLRELLGESKRIRGINKWYFPFKDKGSITFEGVGR